MPRKISRKPYTVTYRDFHTNEIKKIKRRPPVKNHNLDPTDKVKLLTTRNADWQNGDVYEVKRLVHKNANVVQIKNEDNESTFVNAEKLELISKGAKDPRYGLYWSEYLTWP